MAPRLDQVLADLWTDLRPNDQRVLALIGHCYTLESRIRAGERAPAWSELETADRMALVRSMRVVGELAELCAERLELARVSLDEHWREELAR
jgi:hypothetical protein